MVLSQINQGFRHSRLQATRVFQTEHVQTDLILPWHFLCHQLRHLSPVTQGETWASLPLSSPNEVLLLVPSASLEQAPLPRPWVPVPWPHHNTVPIGQYLRQGNARDAGRGSTFSNAHFFFIDQEVTALFFYKPQTLVTSY